MVNLSRARKAPGGSRVSRPRGGLRVLEEVENDLRYLVAGEPPADRAFVAREHFDSEPPGREARLGDPPLEERDLLGARQRPHKASARAGTSPTQVSKRSHNSTPTGPHA